MAAISSIGFRPSRWKAIVLIALSFWLGSSLLLDVVIMPALYASGMMTDPGFATMGFSIFWLFNRIELLTAACVLTGMLGLQSIDRAVRLNRMAIALSVCLLAIPALYVYVLTPQMSAMGMPLDLFARTTEIPQAMQSMQGGYWLLETVKLGATGVLLSLCYNLDA